MSDFDRALTFVLRAEGGFVDDPDDPGGATNMGITQHTFDAWNLAKGAMTYSVEHITRPTVSAIYFENYWKVAGCDSLDWPMNLIVFDTAVNQGYGMAIQVARASEGLGVNAAIAVRRYVYMRLAGAKPEFEKFLKGWLNRMEALRKEAS